LTSENKFIQVDLPKDSLPSHIEERKQKILIVDDNVYNNDANKNMLRKIVKEACSEFEIITGSDGVDIIN